MSEVVVRYTERVSRGNDEYDAQACGAAAADGLWDGWIEFRRTDGFALRTPRETKQPNRDALLYWAEGLTTTYLEGALQRARDTVRDPAPEAPASATVPFDAGALDGRPLSSESHRPVLDPFATYAQGRDLLRRQLTALSRDHLVTMIETYRLPVEREASLPKSALVDNIVRAVHDSLVV